MSWYYSFRGKQKGPVSARDLLVLEASGLITGSSIIWAEGMPDWRPIDAVRDQVKVEAGDEDLSQYVVCSHSQVVRLRAEMIAYGNHWIAPEHKDEFIQSLHEGTILSDPLHEGELRYVGFWWRVLASVIDAMIKGAINMMFMIPLGLLAVPAIEKLSKGGGPPDPDMMAGVIASVMGAYAFMFLATIVSSLVYEVWMVGKYGGTVGKLALRFKIVNADGSNVSYAKAFARWAAEVLGKFIFFSIAYILNIMIVMLFGIATGAMGGGSGGGDPSPVLVMLIMVVCALVTYLACFPWWMAAHTREKKALHDVICGTRVIFR
ncbi:MAG: RDD family protein [Verrucomicrobiales bacterium]